MKKIVLLITLALFAYIDTSAQSLSLAWINGAISNGSTITVIGGITGTITALVDCKNESLSPVSVKVRKKELSLTAGSDNYFCWASCYGSTVFVSPTALIIDPDSICHYFSGDYKPQGNAGISYIMYTFFNSGNNNDSICVVVKYDCSLSSIGAISSEKIEFSNAYPNPADDQAFFTYSLPNAIPGNNEFVIRDMLGNLVIEIPVTEKGGTLKVYTDKMNNGVYFYSLIIQGKINSTKKLIVRH